MLRNYFIIAWRNLWNNKLFSLIYLAGLTISIAVALVVYLIVQHEYSYDTFHKDRDRIFRVVTKTFFLGEEYPNSGVPIPLAQVVQDHLAGIDEAVGFFRMHNYPVTILTKNGIMEKVFKHQDHVVLTDPGYFRLFEHQWLAGSPETSLKDPFNVVLTESKAQTYFGLVHATDALGREIIYGDSIQTVVSGIVKDIKELTDFDFKEFISISTIAASNLKDRWHVDRWDNVDSDFQLMVKLSKGTDPQAMETELVSLREIYDEPHEYEQIHLLQPLSNLHFNAQYGSFLRPVANKTTLGGLLVAAILLLALGSINYVNLTTAHGNQRAKEIGIRKTLGSSRYHLVVQFIAESMVLSFFAAMCALLLVPLIIELFQEFIPDGLAQEPLLKPRILLFLLALTGTMSIVTGLYPGLVLSHFKPISTLKNAGVNNYSRKSLIQQTLMVVQFTVAVFFIVSTLVVASQIRFALNMDLGFKEEGIIGFIVPNSEPLASDLLLAELNQIPEIDFVSRGGASPSGTSVTERVLKFYQGGDVLETSVQLKYGDENYLNVYNIPLIAGKNITTSDTIKEFIINQSFLRRLAIEEPQLAIGQLLEGDGGNLPIVGVVADFHTQPIHQAIVPTAITNAVNNSSFHIALKQFDNSVVPWKRTFEKIESAWNKIYPEEPFTYAFYDQRIASWYRQEQNTSKLLGWITATALFISCLGLLGLTVFIVNQRTKEIGIRKVLGVTIGGIVLLLSKDFIKLVLISILIGIPFAWYFVSKWLQNFAYPVDIQWWMFALPAFCMFVVAGITISSQVLKAALANPVDSLRSE